MATACKAVKTIDETMENQQMMATSKENVVNTTSNAEVPLTPFLSGKWTTLFRWSS
jgi:hypothetical protein